MDSEEPLSTNKIIKLQSITTPMIKDSKTRLEYEEEGGHEDDDDQYKKVETTRQPRCNGVLQDVPDWMRDNDYIKSGYRIDYEGAGELSTTICKCHNETVNIWTHLVGSLVMLTSGIMYLIFSENIS